MELGEPLAAEASFSRYDVSVIDPPQSEIPESNPQGDATTCLCCSEVFRGRFCPACGQEASTGVLRLRDLLRDAFEEYLGLDSRTVNTVVGLTRDPGGVCRTYVEGQRVRLISPIRYFLIAITLTILLNLFIGLDASTLPSQLSVSLTELQQQVQQEVGDFVFRHLDAVVILALPFLIGLVRLLYRKSGFTYAEVSVFVLYLIGHAFLIGLLFTPLKPAYPLPMALGKLLFLLFFFTWAGANFFRVSKIEAAIKGGIITVFFFLLVALAVLAMVLPRIASIMRSNP